jgi:hypothetical protein
MSKLFKCLEQLYLQILPHKDLPVDLFPSKISEFMSQIVYPSQLNDKDVIDLTLQVSPHPAQHYTEKQFGEYNFTVFYNESFSIQLYLMNEIDTEIHDHSFVGCFQVLQGANIHTEFEFQKDQASEMDIELGVARSKKVTTMKQFDVMPLQEGVIHQITRTSKKNITLMVMKHVKTTSNCLLLPPHARITNPDFPKDLVRRLHALGYYYSQYRSIEPNHLNLIHEVKSKYLLVLAVRLQNLGLGRDFSVFLIGIIHAELRKRNLLYIIEDYVQLLRRHKQKIDLVRSK